MDGTAALVQRASKSDGARPHFHRPDANQNIWDFSADFTTLSGLAFSGGAAGLRVEGGNMLRIEGCGTVAITGFSRQPTRSFATTSFSPRAPPMSVFPAPSGALVSTADPTYLSDDDFNGNLRSDAADVGAYLFAAAGNPGWPLSEDLKGYPKPMQAPALTWVTPGPAPARMTLPRTTGAVDAAPAGPHQRVSSASFSCSL